jgi:hypothetical protein
MTIMAHMRTVMEVTILAMIATGVSEEGDGVTIL